MLSQYQKDRSQKDMAEGDVKIRLIGRTGGSQGNDRALMKVS